jgi:hypothetical protein
VGSLNATPCCKPLTDPIQEGRFPVLSSDGTTVAFAANQRIRLMGTNGVSGPSIAFGAPVDTLALSPDLASLAVRSNGGIWRVTVKTGSKQRLFDGSEPAWG